MLEGYIKYKCNLTHRELDYCTEITDINKVRVRLCKHKLLGVYPSGISYGNISMRLNDVKFIITGTQTGNIAMLEAKHFSIVTEYDIDQNLLNCLGERNASSEALSHAAIYKALPNCNAVIHIHSLSIWKNILYKVPTISESAEYGTPEIANALIETVLENKNTNEGIIALAGHYEGIISYAETIEAAESIIMKYI